MDNFLGRELNLTEYLAARGAKMLLLCEAQAFGIPNPLERGWAARHGGMELTMMHLEAVFKGLEGNRRPSSMNARRGLLAAARACLAGQGAVGLPWAV